MSTPEFKEPNISDEPTDTAVTHDEANDKGFLGAVFDLNPNESYTVAGKAGGTGGASASKSSAKSSKSDS